MVDNKKNRLHPHKTSKSDGRTAEKCDGCNGYTRYKGTCAVCEAPHNDDKLRYEGVYKPYERLL